MIGGKMSGTSWTNSFRNRIQQRNSIEGFTATKKGTKVGVSTEKAEQIIDTLGAEMLKRMKQEYRRKKYLMAMENYKHIELLQNLDDDTSSASSDDDSSEDDENNKNENDNENDDEREDESEDENDDESEDDLSEKNDKEEDEVDSSEDEDKNESEDENDAAEGFTNKKANKGQNGNKSHSKSRGLMNFQEFISGLVSEFIAFNDFITQSILIFLSLGTKTTKKDSQFVDSAWVYFWCCIVAFCVFLNWYYVLYLKYVSGQMVGANIDYSFDQSMSQISAINSMKILFAIPLRTLDWIKSTFSFFVRYAPLHFGLGYEFMIIGLFILAYLFVHSTGGQIRGLFDLLTGNANTAFSITMAVVIGVIAFCHICLQFLDPEETPLLDVFVKSSGYLQPIIYILWWMIKIFICIPLSIMVVILFIIYASIFPMMFQPIEGKGFMGTMSDVFRSLREFNPVFNPKIDIQGCTAAGDICKEHDGPLSYLWHKIIIPGHIFIVRHLFTAVIVLLLGFLLVTGYKILDSFQVKSNLAVICSIVSLLLITSNNWLQEMSIDYPTAPRDGTQLLSVDEHKSINMGWTPTLSGILFLFFYFTIICSYFFWETRTGKTITGIGFFVLLSVLLIYHILHNKGPLTGSMRYLPVFLSFLFFAVVMVIMFSEHVMSSPLMITAAVVGGIGVISTALLNSEFFTQQFGQSS